MARKTPREAPEFRTRVTNGEMINMQNGHGERLNQAQVDHLRAHAPSWVNVTAVPIDQHYFHVLLDDTRPDSPFFRGGSILK